MNTSEHLTYSEYQVIIKIYKLFGYQHKKFIHDVIKHGYNHYNCYHNVLHIYEVVNVTCILIEHIGSNLSNRSKFLLKIAALCHDIGHIGKNNNYLKRFVVDYCDNDDIRSYSHDDIINESHNMEYNHDNRENIKYFIAHKSRTKSWDNNTFISSDASFNEEWHVKTAFTFINQYKLLSTKKYKKEYEIIRTLILSTSLHYNTEYLQYIKTDFDKSDDNLKTMIAILKLADVSHTFATDFKTHLYWVCKRFEEDDETFKDVKDLAHNSIEFMNTFVSPILCIIDNNRKSLLLSRIKQMFFKNMKVWKEML